MNKNGGRPERPEWQNVPVKGLDGKYYRNGEPIETEQALRWIKERESKGRQAERVAELGRVVLTERLNGHELELPIETPPRYISVEFTQFGAVAAEVIEVVPLDETL